MDLLERDQRRVAEMTQGMEHHSYKDRLRELEKRRLRGDLRVAFQYLKGGYRRGQTL